MIAAPLYRLLGGTHAEETSARFHPQLFNQLSQWIVPKDLRHLTNCAEIVAAILSAESASLAHWIPYLSHRDCQARSHLARLSYFMHNRQINQELFYRPLIEQFLQAWSGEELVLVMDTSMFWDTYCLIEVCFVKSLCHRALPLPKLTPFPWLQIPPAFASHKKHEKLDRRIEFSKVILFSYS